MKIRSDAKNVIENKVGKKTLMICLIVYMYIFRSPSLQISISYDTSARDIAGL